MGATLLIDGRRESAFVGWAVCSLAAGLLAALLLAAYGQSGAVALVIAGPVVGLLAVRD